MQRPLPVHPLSLSRGACTTMTLSPAKGLSPMTRNSRKIQFFRGRIPRFECTPGCHDCCGPVTASSEEMARLPVKSEAEHDAALASLSCPHLGDQGCQVYAERPLICRLFGATPRLPCPRGKRPEGMVDPQIEQQIHRFFCRDAPGVGLRQVNFFYLYCVHSQWQTNELLLHPNLSQRK